MKPLPRAISISALIGVAMMAYVAGVLTVNESRPSSWEECMVQNMDKARTKGALGVLAQYCKAYPRRGK